MDADVSCYGSSACFIWYDHDCGTATTDEQHPADLMPGVVRAPVLTTVMQVASRFLLVWGIGQFFPATTAASPAFSSMLLSIYQSSFAAAG